MRSPIIYQKENLKNNIYQYSKEGWGYVKDGEFLKEKDESTIHKLDNIPKSG